MYFRDFLNTANALIDIQFQDFQFTVHQNGIRPCDYRCKFCLLQAFKHNWALVRSQVVDDLAILHGNVSGRPDKVSEIFFGLAGCGRIEYQRVYWKRIVLRV